MSGGKTRSFPYVCIVIFLTTILALVSFPFYAVAQEITADKAALEQLSAFFEQRLEDRRPQLYYDLLETPFVRALHETSEIRLMYINERGFPVFYTPHNLNSARTISTDEVWPGGSTGYNLTGAGTAFGELALWDGNGVLTTHVEFAGRVVQRDVPAVPPFLSNHSTHVAGTMVAAGLDANAQGMSYQANLDAYEWTNDNGEMAAAAAAGLQVSNHSYGTSSGWGRTVDGDGPGGNPPAPSWWGDTTVDNFEDFGFGFYDSDAQDWDQIAVNAPEYLIVKSAGNDRNDVQDGTLGHWVYDWNTFTFSWSTAARDRDGGADGYDCIGHRGNAKNILTVGSCVEIPGGYTGPGDVVLSAFSSWGPTDDGRIKPDIVANGDWLWSTGANNNNHYYSTGGTSMSSPSVAGSVNLLARQYENRFASLPWASTLKALVIHTADEAGAADGPDYEAGWGLMNTARAADVVAAPAAQAGIIEATLNQGATDTYTFNVLGTTMVQATIVWTDPAGTPPAASLNPTTVMLVNDLDIRMEHVPTATVHAPWALDGAFPGNPAVRADNELDNVEKIDVASGAPGQYQVRVTHKGTLQGGSQDYSLIWSIDNQPPIADAGPDQTVECAGATTSVTLDGTGSSDPEGDPLTYLWTAPGVTFDDPSSPTPTGQFPLGTTTVTLTVSDGELEDTDTVDITVEDTTPPSITCPGDITVECSDFCGTPWDDPQLSAFFAGVSASDVCCAVNVTNDAPACFALGTTTVTFTATDCVGNASSCTADVTVEDTTPPEITVTLNRDRLWPPNHKMADIFATVTVADACDPDPTFVLTSVESNEPDNGKGDGKTVNDIQDADVGTPDTHIRLRSERSGRGDGRIYTIVYTVEDCSGNTSEATVAVRVPHDHSGFALASLGFVSDGTAFENGTQRFAVVIPSRPAMFAMDVYGNRIQVEKGFNATKIDPFHVYVGNTAGAIRPVDVAHIDVNGDGKKDLGLFYVAGDAEAIKAATMPEGDENDMYIEIAQGHGPIGLHYQGEDGTDYLVSNIFALGEPIPFDWEPGQGNRERDFEEDPLVVSRPGGDAASYSYGIASIFPNPFNPATTIRFTLAEASDVTIAVYDVNGKLVRTLVDRQLSEGEHTAAWDGTDTRGNMVATGGYCARMIAGHFTETRKMVLLK
jgi:hypothetical protein